MVSGGDFLGEGTYGCVFKPSPPCKKPEDEKVMIARKKPVASATNPKSVAKIFIKQSYLDEEWEKAEAIARVDPDQKYFLYATSKCSVSSTSLRKDITATRCSKVNSKQGRDYPMLKMPEGGETLIHRVTSKKITLKEFLQYMVCVFEGIQLMNRFGLIHQDLKFDNILVWQRDKLAKIIDMGLLTERKHAFNPMKNLYLFSRYWLHPPEYRILQHMWMKGSYNMDAIQARKLLTEDMKISSLRFHKSDPLDVGSMITQQVFYFCDYDHEYTAYVKSLAKFNTIQEVQSAMTRYANRVDVYSIGLCMVYLTSYIDSSLLTKDSAYRTLLQRLVHPNPRKRYSANKAIASLKNIISSL